MKNVLKNAQNSAGWLTNSLNEGGLGIWVWDLETGLVELDKVEKEFFGLGHLESPFDARAIVDNIHLEDIDAVNMALDIAIEQGLPFRADFRYNRPKGRQIWIRGRASIIEPHGDGHKFLAGVNFDITEEKNREHQERFVAEEMVHRTKNLISLISGVSRMTARNAKDIGSYQTALESRLHAIDAANTFILNGDGSQGVPLENLVSNTLKMYEGQSRLEISITHLILNSRAAQTLSLLLNELATNAIKYGALRENGGTVDLKIFVQDDWLKLIWTENNPMPIGPEPKHKGFGSQVTLGITKSTFSGQPQLDWNEYGIHYQCIWPSVAMFI